MRDLTTQATELDQIVLVFDDNRLVGDLFGQFDQNLALLEQLLSVEALARG
ncbi:MAG: phosphate starvation-inducible protein PhoH, partial [Hyphomicrobiales bacterium]